MIRRRTAVPVVALLLCCALSCLGDWADVPEEAPKKLGRPNILVIITDDHSADVYRAYGNDIVRTPNLDRLAAQGVRFERAYANAPVCTPSRQSFLTGLYPHAAGVTLLRTALGDAPLTLAEHFSAHGYRTAAFGKMHFNSGRTHGFEARVDLKEYQGYLKTHPRRAPPDNVPVRPPWKPFRDPARIWLNADVLPEGRYDDDTLSSYLVRTAARFMKQQDERPFLLFLSFREPHSPFNFPVEYAGRVRPQDMPVPPIGPEDPPQIPLVFKNLGREDKQGIAASYYTSVEFVDAKVGEALAALKNIGIERNTIVLYFGDHGYHLGHHGRFEKHCFYERAVRAPLVISNPARYKGGREVKEMVEFVDIFPTICEQAGVPVPENLHGRSLVPLLTAEEGAKGRPFVFSSYAPNEEAMIRTDEWKLIYTTGIMADDMGYKPELPPSGRTIRLYNLKYDPEEMKNLGDHPECRRIRDGLVERLHRRLKETWPEDLPPPEGLSREEEIDWMLSPVERRREK